MEGNLHFKTDWASLIVGSKFTVFASFALYLRACNFLSTSPGEAYIFALQVWGAYIWSGLYVEGLIFGILRYVHKYLARLVLPVVSNSGKWKGL